MNLPHLTKTGLTNNEFALLDQDHSKFWECDNWLLKIYFYALDEDNWLTFNGIPTQQTSDDINIISADDRKFASLCEHIQINSENGDDILSNHVNSKCYDLKQLNSTNFDLPSSFGFFDANIASLNLHIDDLRHVSLTSLAFRNIKFVRIYHHLTISRFLVTTNSILNLQKLRMGEQVFILKIMLIIS